MNRLLLAIATAGLACGTAGATTLVDLVDAPSQAGTAYSFALTASSASTALSFAGYEVPNGEAAYAIVFADASGTDLLTPGWDFTPASTGSWAEQGTDGTRLTFGGYTEGDYDTFSRTLATTAGAHYALTFLFSNYADTQNGFRVTTNADVAAVPEPATWAMTIMGFGLIGGAMRGRHTSPRLARTSDSPKSG